MENIFAPEWVLDTIFYQIFPDRFCNGDKSNDLVDIEQWGNPPMRENFFGGDLQGIRNKLDYLQDLGINGIYLNPIFKARTNHKYDTEDYFSIDPSFGNNDLFKKLVLEIHERKMHIILDGVFNHCGERFKQFESVKKFGQKSPYSDWFQIRSYPIIQNPINYYSCGGCTYLPKFNNDNPAVRKYIYQVASYWSEKAGIDGWRLDCAQKIPKEFWHDFRDNAKKVNSQSYLVGEIWHEPVAWIQGDTFDGVTNYLLRELIINYFSNDILDAEDFSYEITSLLQRQGNASYSMLNLLGCHDTERIFSVFEGEMNRYLMAIVFLFSFIGIPLIYYGDEIGMVGGKDPDCRRTMIWDEGVWNVNINEMYRKMIKIRNTHVALRRGDYTKLLFFNKVFAFKRSYESDEVITILNPGSTVLDLEISTYSKNKKWFDLFSGNEIAISTEILKIKKIDAFSYLVLSNSKKENPDFPVSYGYSR